jgi:uncharacterized membrane protein YGL010W
LKTFFVEQLAMYTSYHRDGRNKATHFVGVPAIAISLLLPMALVPLFTVSGYGVTLAALFGLAVMLFWIVMDPPFGLATSLIFVPAVIFAEWLPGQDSGQGIGHVWMLFGLLFVGGWIIQLVGHVFEGRKPALADNLLQVFIAPVFLMTEVAFALGLRKSLEKAVEMRWRAYLPGAVGKDVGEVTAE